MISGCSNLVEKGNEDTDSEFPPTMSGIVIINGTEYQMDEGNYRWERKKGLDTEAVQTGHASPYQMAEEVLQAIIKLSDKRVRRAYYLVIAF